MVIFTRKIVLLWQKKNKNIIFDTSSTPYPKLIKKAVETLGKERVVFASDGPAGDPVSEVEKIRMLNFSKDIEDCIFYKNISQLLNI